MEIFDVLSEGPDGVEVLLPASLKPPAAAQQRHHGRKLGENYTGIGGRSLIGYMLVERDGVRVVVLQ